jgi:spore coat polysaccharide biosynthesis protein SpsF (cytidylyltransferase family)
MRLAVVVQARANSYRLPGKATVDIAGRPALSWLLERLSTCREPDAFIVATPRSAENARIAEVAKHEGWEVLRGSETLVVSRVARAALKVNADIVAFLGADQMLMDPQTIDAVLRTAAKGHPYVRTTGQPWGLQAWAVTTDLLLQAVVGATTQEEREHTGAYWDHRPVQYPCHTLRTEPDESKHRLTIDTPDDLALHQYIMGKIGGRWPHVTTADILKLLALYPEWESKTYGVEAWRWAGYDEAVGR